METRHIIGIVAAVGYLAFINRERLKTLAKSAFAKAAPVAKSAKASWLIPLLVAGVVFWPDISKHIPWPSPGPSPQNDTLAASYAADRVTQIAVLRELATQPFDGTTDDGRRQAGEWFNAQRFRNRANDFGAYTDRVADAIAANSEDTLASELEAK